MSDEGVAEADIWMLVTNSEVNLSNSGTWKTAIIPDITLSLDQDNLNNRSPSQGDLVFNLTQTDHNIEFQWVAAINGLDSWELERETDTDTINPTLEIGQFTFFDEPILLNELPNEVPLETTVQRLRNITGFTSENKSKCNRLFNCPLGLVYVLASTSETIRTNIEEQGLDLPEADISEVAEHEIQGLFNDDRAVPEVIDAVLARTDDSDIAQNQLVEGLARQVVDEWTGALEQLETRATVTREENARLQQLKQVYELLEPQLDQIAASLNIESYQGLMPPQVMFMAFLRKLQRTVADDLSHPPNASSKNLKKLFEETVSVIDGGLHVDPTKVVDPNSKETTDLIGHPIGEALREDSLHETYQYQCSLDHLRTVVRHRALCFTELQKSVWNEVSSGDVVFLYTDGSVSRTGIQAHAPGYVGCALISSKAKCDEGWFPDELLELHRHPYLLSFERLYLNGNIDSLNLSFPNTELTDTELEKELSALSTQALQLGDDLANIGSDGNSAMDIVSEDASANAITVFRVIRETLTELSPIAVTEPFNGSIPKSVLDGLYFPNDQGERILRQIEAALRAGKNVILTGPPGTGKTEIAERVASYITKAYPYLYTGTRITTATADWSTFDTIGGYMPDPSADSDQLMFTPGLFTSCFRDHEDGRRLNEPLVVDELNRADIDKAFGQLFTVLADQSVELPFTTKNDSLLRLVTSTDATTVPDDANYIVPESWLMFGTINTYDKTSLYEMSYAFMRRFAFIQVDAPDIPDNQAERIAMMETFTNCWGIKIDNFEASNGDKTSQSVNQTILNQLGDIWHAVNGAIEGRAIGPAIFRDLLNYIRRHRDSQAGGLGVSESVMTEAVISYVLPQLEGVPDRDQLIKNIAKTEGVNGLKLCQAAQKLLNLPHLELTED